MCTIKYIVPKQRDVESHLCHVLNEQIVTVDMLNGHYHGVYDGISSELIDFLQFIEQVTNGDFK